MFTLKCQKYNQNVIYIKKYVEFIDAVWIYTCPGSAVLEFYIFIKQKILRCWS